MVVEHSYFHKAHRHFHILFGPKTIFQRTEMFPVDHFLKKTVDFKVQIHSRVKILIVFFIRLHCDYVQSGIEEVDYNFMLRIFKWHNCVTGTAVFVKCDLIDHEQVLMNVMFTWFWLEIFCFKNSLLCVCSVKLTILQS